VFCCENRSFAKYLCFIAGNHVHNGYGVEGMLPVNDQKRVQLIVQVKILTQQTPQRGRLDAGGAIVNVVSERLDVAGQAPFNRKSFFERRTRRHPAVMIDSDDALAKQNGRLRVETRAKSIGSDCH
jgi:hypothetical protein